MKVDPKVLSGQRIRTDFRNVFLGVKLLLEGIDTGALTEAQAREGFLRGGGYRTYQERYPDHQVGDTIRDYVLELNGLVYELNGYLDRREFPVDRLRYIDERSRDIIIGK